MGSSLADDVVRSGRRKDTSEEEQDTLSKNRREQEGAADAVDTKEDDKSIPEPLDDKNAVTGASAKASAKRKSTVKESDNAKRAKKSHDKSDNTFGGEIDESLSPADQQFLEADILARLKEVVPDKSKDDHMDLAELVSCMLQVKRTPAEVQSELSVFLNGDAGDLVKWLIHHLNGTWLRSRRARTAVPSQQRSK